MPISDLPREAQQIAANLRRTESEQAALEDAYKKTYPSISSEPATTSEEPLDPEMQALKEKYELRGDGDDDQPLTLQRKITESNRNCGSAGARTMR